MYHSNEIFMFSYNPFEKRVLSCCLSRVLKNYNTTQISNPMVESHLCSIFNVVRDEDWMIKVNDLYGRLMVIIKSFSWQFKRLIKRFGDDSTSDARDKNIFSNSHHIKGIRQTFSDVWLSHNPLSRKLYYIFYVYLREKKDDTIQHNKVKKQNQVWNVLFHFSSLFSSSSSSSFVRRLCRWEMRYIYFPFKNYIMWISKVSSALFCIRMESWVVECGPKAKWNLLQPFTWLMDHQN